MKPSKDPSTNSISTPSKDPSQRKLHGQHQNSTVSKTFRQTPTSSHQTIDLTEDESTPSAKRLKTSHSSAKIVRPENMSRTVGLRTPRAFVDLTRAPSNFQPHAGAKKLVIKNLRTTSRADLEEYYEKTWREVDDALTAVFKREDPRVPLEVLCRGVEATCRHGKAQKLFDHLKERCKTYLEKRLLPEVEKEGTGTNVDALRAVWRFWSLWNEQSVRGHQTIRLLEYMANHASRP